MSRIMSHALVALASFAVGALAGGLVAATSPPRPAAEPADAAVIVLTTDPGLGDGAAATADTHRWEFKFGRPEDTLAARDAALTAVWPVSLARQNLR